ncbi:MAG TPA: hypothetical protein VFB35_07650 [Gaiellaceae bacterium]|nr:hypothetical protein [Gaiellaceae bacterium]
MKKFHALTVALVLATTAIVGVVAATRTTNLAAGSSADRAALTARAHRLDRLQASLRKALADRPPALPPLRTSAGTAPPRAQRVVYRRPAPIVVIKHRPGGETESEHEDGEHEDGEHDD